VAHNATVIGLGFVGLTTATFFANRGIKVYGIDSDIERIEAIKEDRIPFFEPKLDHFVKKALFSQMLIVNNDLYNSVKNSKFIFICVGTPMCEDGKVDLTNITKISKEIGTTIKNIKKYQVLCVKSTVPPRTTENNILTTIEKTSGKIAYKDFGIVFIPEFLSEGSAVKDMTKPHKIVIGTNDTKSLLSIDTFLVKIYGRGTHTVKTNIVTAELIKYANNAFLATKISFINTIANICNLLPGADVDIIAKALGSDPRIGNQFLVAGPGYGGSCLPKDLSGFIVCCEETGYEPILLKATDAVNKDQIVIIMNILNKRLGTLKGKSISILGTAFKKNTDDIREGVSINLIRKLKNLSKVNVHDPKALDNTRKIFGRSIKYSYSLKDVLNDCDCLIIMTAWDEYKGITQKQILENNKNRPVLVVDTSRLLKFKKLIRSIMWLLVRTRLFISNFESLPIGLWITDINE
jgi:UDPglucose 6-dehydrogenase